jgi:hypothetical protein
MLEAADPAAETSEATEEWRVAWVVERMMAAIVSTRMAEGMNSDQRGRHSFPRLPRAMP